MLLRGRVNGVLRSVAEVRCLLPYEEVVEKISLSLLLSDCGALLGTLEVLMNAFMSSSSFLSSLIGYLCSSLNFIISVIDEYCH